MLRLELLGRTYSPALRANAYSCSCYVTCSTIRFEIKRSGCRVNAYTFSSDHEHLTEFLRERAPLLIAPIGVFPTNRCVAEHVETSLNHRAQLNRLRLNFKSRLGGEVCYFPNFFHHRIWNKIETTVRHDI